MEEDETRDPSSNDGFNTDLDGDSMAAYILT
jgi:hypothetical protein